MAAESLYLISGVNQALVGFVAVESIVEE